MLDRTALRLHLKSPGQVFNLILLVIYIPHWSSESLQCDAEDAFRTRRTDEVLPQNISRCLTEPLPSDSHPHSTLRHTPARHLGLQTLLPRKPNICDMTEAPTQPQPQPQQEAQPQPQSQPRPQPQQEPQPQLQPQPQPQLQYSPAPLGMEVRGVDLKDPGLPDSLVQQIKRDVHRHRLLIFKDQGVVSGERHVEISRWFGDVRADFEIHRKSPHPLLLRVSNDETEGFTGVGRSGWHMDGGFYEKPYSITLYHMVAVPTAGDTAFVPLKEVVESLSNETRARWDRLWRVDHRWEGRNPLLYSHPVTGDPTLCFHNGATDGFVWDYKTERERYTDRSETWQLVQEIHREITKDNNRLVYSHKVAHYVILDQL
nr:hypothetical protein BaRGS_022875 [Batillaria attramentaria]